MHISLSQEPAGELLVDNLTNLVIYEGAAEAESAACFRDLDLE